MDLDRPQGALPLGPPHKPPRSCGQGASKRRRAAPPESAAEATRPWHAIRPGRKRRALAPESKAIPVDRRHRELCRAPRVRLMPLYKRLSGQEGRLRCEWDGSRPPRPPKSCVSHKALGIPAAGRASLCLGGLSPVLDREPGTGRRLLTKARRPVAAAMRGVAVACARREGHEG